MAGDNDGPTLVAVTTVFLVFTWLSVCARAGTRIFLTNTFAVDDWLMVTTLVSSTPAMIDSNRSDNRKVNFTLMAGFIYAGVHFGLGRHNAALSKQNEIQAVKVYTVITLLFNLLTYTKYQALATILYISTMGFVKVSIGIFLLRIAIQKRYIYILRISIVIIALWTIGIFLFEIFQCQPVAAQWDTTILGGHCVPAESFVEGAYAFSVLAVLSDWLYALLPIPIMWNVQMTIQAKVGVIGILALGIL
jgi:hypothetical protein